MEASKSTEWISEGSACSELEASEGNEQHVIPSGMKALEGQALR